MSTEPSGLLDTSGAAELAKCEAPPNESVLIDDVLAMVNQIRRGEGMRPLVLEPTLTTVANDYACEMIEDGFFAHQNPETKVSPGERLTQSGYIFYSMGENLGVGQPTAVEVVADWLQSPGHRANILSPDWRETGIAIRTGGEYGWYWVQEFAEPFELSSVDDK